MRLTQKEIKQLTPEMVQLPTEAPQFACFKNGAVVLQLARLEIKRNGRVAVLLAPNGWPVYTIGHSGEKCFLFYRSEEDAQVVINAFHHDQDTHGETWDLWTESTEPTMAAKWHMYDLDAALKNQVAAGEKTAEGAQQDYFEARAQYIGDNGQTAPKAFCIHCDKPAISAVVLIDHQRDGAQVTENLCFDHSAGYGEIEPLTRINPRYSFLEFTTPKAYHRATHEETNEWVARIHRGPTEESLAGIEHKETHDPEA